MVSVHSRTSQEMMQKAGDEFIRWEYCVYYSG